MSNLVMKATGDIAIAHACLAMHPFYAVLRPGAGTAERPWGSAVSGGPPG